MTFSSSETIAIYVATLSFLLAIILQSVVAFSVGAPQVAIIIASRHYRQGKLGVGPAKESP
jgi:hypothetical protein